MLVLYYINYIFCRFMPRLTRRIWASQWARWSKPTSSSLFFDTLADLSRSKTELVVENALLRQQLIVLRRQVKRPQLTNMDRALLVLLASKLLTWKSALLIVQPDTLLRWHRQGFRLFWKRRSKTTFRKPRLPVETTDLIKQMALDNWLWGAERIRGELLKLDIQVCKRTVQKYMRQARKQGPSDRRSNQNWSTFLHNQGGKVVLTKMITVNDPLNYKGINFFLSSYQSVAYLLARGPSGENIPIKEIGASAPVTVTTTTVDGALVPFRSLSDANLPTDLVQFSVPGHTISLEMKYYQDVTRSENENPPIYIRAYVDTNVEKPIYDAFLQRTGPFKLPGYEQYPVTFKKDTVTILEIAKDPGLGLVTFFFMIMAAGFTVSLYTSFTRCWVRITPSAENAESVNVLVCGLAEKNKVSFERDFERLAGRIRDKLASATQNE